MKRFLSILLSLVMVLSMIGGILRKAPADVQGETFKEITESFGTAPEKENGQ